MTEALLAGCFADVPPKFVPGEALAVPADYMSRTPRQVSQAQKPLQKLAACSEQENPA